MVQYKTKQINQSKQINKQTHYQAKQIYSNEQTRIFLYIKNCSNLQMIRSHEMN